LHYLTHQRLITDYALVSAIALLIYDYLLTIRLEVIFVWFSPWTYTKVLFLFARYLPIINIYFLIHNQLLPDVSEHSCTWTFTVAVWILMSGIAVAEDIFPSTVILMIRTWAVWHQNRTVGIGLAILMCGILILECVCNSRFIKSLNIQPAPYRGFKGCFVTAESSSVLLIDFMALTVLELIVLTLMAISAFRACRSGDNLELSNVIYRDGILSYVYLLCVALANVIVMLVSPSELKILLSPLQSVMYSALTCRIIINIRSVASRTCEASTEFEHLGTGSPVIPSFTLDDQFSSEDTVPMPEASCSRSPLSPV